VSDPFPPINEAVLRAALSLADFDGRAAQRLMEPVARGRPPRAGADVSERPAATLAFLHLRDEGWGLPLTLRHDALREHSGQVSLPGGRPEAGETLWETALREAREEIDLDPAAVRPLGTLAPVYIPVTHTRMVVHVGLGHEAPDFTPNPDEVVRVETVPLRHLLSARRRRTTTRVIEGRRVQIPYFDLGGLVVWGATAMALSEIAERLRRVL
jgi:8-oxo-dGTP pyrophosphatase MutT (NUDIX family)